MGTTGCEACSRYSSFNDFGGANRLEGCRSCPAKAGIEKISNGREFAFPAFEKHLPGAEELVRLELGGSVVISKDPHHSNSDEGCDSFRAPLVGRTRSAWAGITQVSLMKRLDREIPSREHRLKPV